MTNRLFREGNCGLFPPNISLISSKTKEENTFQIHVFVKAAARASHIKFLARLVHISFIYLFLYQFTILVLPLLICSIIIALYRSYDFSDWPLACFVLLHVIFGSWSRLGGGKETKTPSFSLCFLYLP